MQMISKVVLLVLLFPAMLIGCKKDNIDHKSDAELVFKFKFDSTQQRLNNFGQPATLPDSHAAQHPTFNSISGHYIEIIPDKWTGLGKGQILYQSPTSTAGGDTAIDFSESKQVGEGEVFHKLPLKDIAPGTYKYIRVSLSYQNFDIDLRAQGHDLKGTLAAFIGYNTYIQSYVIKNESITVDANKKQGYWGFETQYGTLTGQAPGTTVPNPLATTSPIPPGSCLVTGELVEPLTITGEETTDKTVEISVSTNNSFEWKDPNGNDIFEPQDGEAVVDMGIRGLKGIVK